MAVNVLAEFDPPARVNVLDEFDPPDRVNVLDEFDPPAGGAARVGEDLLGRQSDTPLPNLPVAATTIPGMLAEDRAFAATQPLSDKLLRVPGEIGRVSAEAAAGIGKMQGDLEKNPALLAAFPVLAAGAVPGIVARQMGATSPTDTATQFARDVSENALEHTGVDPRYNRTTTSELIGGAASLVPAIAAGPAAPVVMAGMMGESGRKDAVEHGGTAQQQDISFYGNAAVGALSEALMGVPALLRAAKATQVPERTVQAFTRVIAGQTLKGARREGIQEGNEQAAGNYIANTVAGYDPQRGTFDGYLKAVALGAIIGAPVGAVVQGAQSYDSAKQTEETLAKASTEKLIEVATDPEALEALSYHRSYLDNELKRRGMEPPPPPSTAPESTAAAARTRPVVFEMPEVEPPPLPSGRLGPPDPIAPETEAPQVFEKPPKPFAPIVQGPVTEAQYGRELDVYDLTAGLDQRAAAQAQAAGAPLTAAAVATPEPIPTFDEFARAEFARIRADAADPLSGIKPSKAELKKKLATTFDQFMGLMRPYLEGDYGRKFLGKSEEETAVAAPQPLAAPAPEPVTPEPAAIADIAPSPAETAAVEPVAPKVGDVIEAQSHQINGLVHKGRVTSVEGNEIGMVNQDNAPVLVLRENVKSVSPETVPTSAPVTPQPESAPIGSAPKVAPADTLRGGRKTGTVPVVSEGVPILTSSRWHGDSTISIAFDATGKVPTPNELEEMFAKQGHKVSVTKMHGITSAATGTVKFKVNAYEDTPTGNVRDSKKAAGAAYKAMTGSDTPITGQSELQRAAPLQERFTAAWQYGAEALGLKGESATALPIAAPPAAPQRVQLRTGPQTYTAEQLPPQKGDQPGEIYFRVTNERTGAQQVVESKDMKPVRAKGAKPTAGQAKGMKRKLDAGESGGTQGGIAGGSPLLPNTAPTAPVVPVKAMSQIIRDIAKGIDVPIRFGRLTTTKFAGYFKKVQNLIGAKNANDMQIVSHETGHKLDDAFGISKMPALRAELDALGDPATPGSRSSWTKSKSLKYKHGEGVAEFVRHWLTDPAKAAKDAPKTNAYFEAVMDANPDFGDVMRTAREDVQNWRNAPAEARLDSNISVGDNPNQTRYRLSQLTRDLVDDLHMLKLAVDDATKFSGKDLAPSDNPYLLSRLLRGSYGMADSFIRNGAADFKTRSVKLGTSFEDAVRPVAGRINEFRRWVVAKRAQELHSQGRETGLVRTDVDAVAAKYDSDPAFNKAFEDVKQWNDALLQYAVDSGYVSESSASAMRAMNQDYVPFHRIFEIGAGESPSQSSSGTGRGLNTGKAGSLNRLTGSTRDIVDPLETMIKNAYVFITASEKASINKAIAGLAEQPGMGKWVEEIAAPKEAVKVQLEKVRKDLEAAGADLTAVPDDLVMQFFQNSGRAPFGENVIKVTNAGETKFYRLKSELYDAFNALDLDDSSRLIQLLSQPAQLLRAGVTLDPAFGLANVMRDAVGSAVINRYGMLPFEASARGVAALFKNPKLVAEWAASGGEQSFEASFFDRKKMAKFMRERITKDLTPAEQALVIVKSPLTALRYISGMAESATRIGEFEKAYKEAVKSGMPEGEARRLASFESRDRQDFAKGGTKTKILRHMAAFWNAGLQGNIAVAKAFKNRPVRSTLQGLAYVTLPTLALMALNWDDEDYWDRPQWERDAFWLMPIGKDDNQHTRFLRIPKPFIIGVMFGTMPERLMKFAMKNDPKAFEGAMTQIAQQVIPNPMPQTAQVIVSDALTGKQGWDMWRNMPVVPDSLADLPSELQWTEQTSLTAKKIGGALGFSPMKVDHIIAGTTGGLGRHVVHNVIDQAIGAATGEEPTATNVVPGARFFTTPAGISSHSVEKFYEQLTELREQKAAVKVTGKTMESGADRKRLQMERAADRMSSLRKEAKKAEGAEAKQRKYLEIARLAKEALE